MKAAVEPARTRGGARRPAAARPHGVTRSAELRAAGRAANPPPVRPPGHRGRRIKQSPVPPRRARWGLGERAGLAFLDDLAIPVDNHQAEQDLRRLKVQQQLAGSFRADTGAAAVARIRGYLSSLRKPGGARLAALHSVFSGQPLYPALGWTVPEGLTRDEILDNITLYWLTNTAVSSARLYWVSKLAFFAPKGVVLPVAVSVFPDEIYSAPRSWAERAYPKLIHYNKLDKGGHFAAWEQPQLFSAEVRAAFRSLR
jgi:pimeloyl-ACP methyl ester carboxylesterase